MVVSCPDKNWKLVSSLYYTNKMSLSNKTRFKQIDLKVLEPLASSHCQRLIQTTVSLNDGEKKGRMLVFIDVHRNIVEW